jgi:hypothetical protein
MSDTEVGGRNGDSARMKFKSNLPLGSDAEKGKFSRTAMRKSVYPDETMTEGPGVALGIGSPKTQPPKNNPQRSLLQLPTSHCAPMAGFDE